MLEGNWIRRRLEGLDPDVVAGRVGSVVGMIRTSLDPDVVAGRGLRVRRDVNWIRTLVGRVGSGRCCWKGIGSGCRCWKGIGSERRCWKGIGSVVLDPDIVAGRGLDSSSIGSGHRCWKGIGSVVNWKGIGSDVNWKGTRRIGTGCCCWKDWIRVLLLIVLIDAVVVDCSERIVVADAVVDCSDRHCC